jgi:hypothetical protein
MNDAWNRHDTINMFKLLGYIALFPIMFILFIGSGFGLLTVLKEADYPLE